MFSRNRYRWFPCLLNAFFEAKSISLQTILESECLRKANVCETFSIDEESWNVLCLFRSLERVHAQLPTIVDWWVGVPVFHLLLALFYSFYCCFMKLHVHRWSVLLQWIIQYKATWEGIKNHHIVAFSLWSIVFVVNGDGSYATTNYAWITARFGAHGDIEQGDHP